MGIFCRMSVQHYTETQSRSSVRPASFSQVSLAKPVTAPVLKGFESCPVIISRHVISLRKGKNSFTLSLSSLCLVFPFVLIYSLPGAFFLVMASISGPCEVSAPMRPHSMCVLRTNRPHLSTSGCFHTRKRYIMTRAEAKTDGQQGRFNAGIAKDVTELVGRTPLVS